jgi:hypothetical protein
MIKKPSQATVPLRHGGQASTQRQYETEHGHIMYEGGISLSTDVGRFYTLCTIHEPE